MVADIGRLLTATALVQALNALRNVAVARMLSPYVAGACLSWLALPQVGAYFSLGLVDALPFLLPYHRGRYGEADARLLRNQVWTFHAFVSLGTVLVAVAIVGAFPFTSEDLRLFGLLAAGLLGIVQVCKFAVMELAAEQRFDVLSRTELLYAALLLLGSVIGMARWQGVGFWGALILATAGAILYAYRSHFRQQPIRWVHPDWTVLHGAMPMGIVMIIASAIYLPFMLVARLYVASAIGVQAVGYFFLATVLMTLLAVVPRTLSRVMTPHLSLSCGEGRSCAAILPVFAKVQLASLGLTAIAAGLAFLALVWLVPAWFPEYREGVQPAALALLACLPYSLIDNANSLLVMAHQKRALLWIFGLMLGLQAGLLAWFSAIGTSLERVVVSFIVTFTLYAVLVNVHAVRLGRAASAGSGAMEPPLDRTGSRATSHPSGRTMISSGASVGGRPQGQA
jgi:O-antigen/teichoic acid export membrane protein